MAESAKRKTARKSPAAARKARALRAKRVAAETLDVKLVFQDEINNPGFAHLLAKCRSFMAYHEKIAKDAVGAKITGKDKEGKDTMGEYVLSPEERLSNLDKASGIQEIVDYVDRVLTPPTDALIKAAK